MPAKFNGCCIKSKLCSGGLVVVAVGNPKSVTIVVASPVIIKSSLILGDQYLIRSLESTGSAVGLRSANTAPDTSGVILIPSAKSSLFILATISAVVIDTEVCDIVTTIA